MVTDEVAAALALDANDIFCLAEPPLAFCFDEQVFGGESELQRGLNWMASPRLAVPSKTRRSAKAKAPRTEGSQSERSAGERSSSENVEDGRAVAMDPALAESRELSAYTLACLEEHPHSPVLLRMLQLHLGMLSEGMLTPSALTSREQAPELSTLLSHLMAAPDGRRLAGRLPESRDNLPEGEGRGVLSPLTAKRRTPEDFATGQLVDDMFDILVDWDEVQTTVPTEHSKQSKPVAPSATDESLLNCSVSLNDPKAFAEMADRARQFNDVERSQKRRRIESDEDSVTPSTDQVEPFEQTDPFELVAFELSDRHSKQAMPDNLDASIEHFLSDGVFQV
mmetsp:Transcript_52535/g.112361  ORF Transcript_52535/g.112361 Transcript_52535/m.112361 type:complete len:338 (-) Transcript_52535:276-1289(-)